MSRARKHRAQHPCTTHLAALQRYELIMSDRFLISLLNPQSGCGAVGSTLQKVLLQLVLLVAGADKLLWLFLTSFAGDLLCALRLENNILTRSYSSQGKNECSALPALPALE